MPPKKKKESNQVARDAYVRRIRPALRTGGLECSDECEQEGADFRFWTPGRPRRKRTVELKATETKDDKGFWRWYAHGRGKNGKPHSLLSQCTASGADTLLLAWKENAQSGYAPIRLSELTTKQRRQLVVPCLTRRLEDLPADFGVASLGPADMRATLAAMLP
jgi:hypothetical protein